ncbi:hypothetical protein CI102_3014 [Trichoderma harzianum]|nr:hypothetical protein CI102_3014 [Trichoderma harzianum]
MPQIGLDFQAFSQDNLYQVQIVPDCATKPMSSDPDAMRSRTQVVPDTPYKRKKAMIRLLLYGVLVLLHTYNAAQTISSEQQGGTSSVRTTEPCGAQCSSAWMGSSFATSVGSDSRFRLSSW